MRKFDKRSRIFINLGRVRGLILVGKYEEAYKLLDLISLELTKYKFVSF